MHDNSMVLMKEFVEAYCKPGDRVADIGAYDINGNYRGLFSDGYLGVDIQAGPNVDVLMDSDEWKALKDLDVVISGQTLEHVADIPALMAEIYRVLKPGGFACFIAPSEGPRHDYPIWVGNFPKERMIEVVSDAGFEIIACTISPVLPFMDCRCIARKPESVIPRQKGQDSETE